MADMNIGKFVGGIVSALVATILLVTLVPIISENQVADTVANATTINGIINIVPILIAIALLLGIVGMFIVKRR